MINPNNVKWYNNLGAFLVYTPALLTPWIGAGLTWGQGVNQQTNPFLFRVVEFVNSTSFYIYGVLFLFTITSGLVKLKGKKVVWETTQALVDKLQSIAFPDLHNELNDSHRVTLFKYQQWCLKPFLNRNMKLSIARGYRPWGGWLVPVIRSGHTGKETQTVFYAPDSGILCEGIVGKSWSSSAIVYEEDLPDIKQISSTKNKEKYCKKSNMKTWMLNRYCEEDKPLPRSILATPVMTSTNLLWGVLVFDSRKKSGIDTQEAINAFRVIAEPLGTLLEDVK